MELYGSLLLETNHLRNIYNEAVKDNIPESKQVVALMVDGVLTRDCEVIRYVIKNNDVPIENCITKSVAKWMDKLDLGINWKILSEAEPIFGIDDKGILCLLKNGLYPSKYGWLKMQEQ